MKLTNSVICTLLIMLCGCEREARREHGVPTSPESRANEVRESIRLTDANFERYVFHGDNPVLVYFGAPWCTSCREFAPIIEELAVQFEDRVVVGTVDIDAYPKIAKKFLIHAVPVLLLFQNGEFVTRWDGMHKKEEIATRLRDLNEIVSEGSSGIDQ